MLRLKKYRFSHPRNFLKRLRVKKDGYLKHLGLLMSAQSHSAISSLLIIISHHHFSSSYHNSHILAVAANSPEKSPSLCRRPSGKVYVNAPLKIKQRCIDWSTTQWTHQIELEAANGRRSRDPNAG